MAISITIPRPVSRRVRTRRNDSQSVPGMALRLAIGDLWIRGKCAIVFVKVGSGSLVRGLRFWRNSVAENAPE